MGTFRWNAMDIPVIDEVDVLVAGGGTSGFIAATSAARGGAKVLLIERQGFLGSCTTAPYNTRIEKFVDTHGKRIIAGLAREFMERMQKEDSCVQLDSPAPQIWPPATKKVAIDMVREANVRVLLYTTLLEPVADGGFVRGVVVHNKAGFGYIEAKAFVDATGDADLAAGAGASYEITNFNDIQQVSYDLLACGVDADKVLAWARENPGKIEGAYGLDEDTAPAGSQNMLGFTLPDSHYDADGNKWQHGVSPTVKLFLHREAVRLQHNADVDPLDPDALTQAALDGYAGALEHLQSLKDNIPGFENAYIVSSNHLGVRETRRIIGEHMLTIEECTGEARFDDVVALNCRQLDYHIHGTYTMADSPEGHNAIPLRALLPKALRNVVVAGRCISSDHLSQATLRGAATCLATGHAAGAAAAVAALGHGGDVKATPVADIQSLLLEQKAILHAQ